MPDEIARPFLPLNPGAWLPLIFVREFLVRKSEGRPIGGPLRSRCVD